MDDNIEKSIITEEALTLLIEKAPLDDADKSRLTKGLPGMDNDQRIRLLEAIKDIFVLDEEEKRQIEKIERIS